MDDNLSFHINIKWLLQIFTAIGLVVYGYVQIENRIADLESRMELADTQIEELVNKHIENEEAKIAKMEKEIEWYSKELNLNPLGLISSGSLIITCKPKNTSKLIESISKSGINVSKIGKMTKNNQGLKIEQDNMKSEVPNDEFLGI